MGGIVKLFFGNAFLCSCAMSSKYFQYDTIKSLFLSSMFKVMAWFTYITIQKFRVDTFLCVFERSLLGSLRAAFI